MKRFRIGAMRMEETVQMVMHGVGRQEVTEDLGDRQSIGKEVGEPYIYLR